MSHFVAKPNQKSLKYHIFSTVVMEPITRKMYRAEMVEWLKSHEGHEGFLDPRPLNEQFPESDFFENDLKYMYWNGSFWFVTEEDGWFV